MSLGVGADEEAVEALTFLPLLVVFVLLVLEVLLVFVELLLPLGTGKLAPFSGYTIPL